MRPTDVGDGMSLLISKRPKGGGKKKHYETVGQSGTDQPAGMRNRKRISLELELEREKTVIFST